MTMKKLPVIETGSACGTGSCDSCRTGCGSSFAWERVAAIALLLAGLGLLLWLALGDGLSGTAEAAPALRNQSLGPATVTTAGPTQHYNTIAFTPSQASLVAQQQPTPPGIQVEAKQGGLIPACQGAPMPHGPRGPCLNCHVFKSCAAGDATPGRTPPLSLIPTITRSSLLPHRFAGLCMNCHAVLGVVPRPIDIGHLGNRKLSPEERTLVHAGQRVDMPSVFQHAKAPLIGRNAQLPHSFRGVCSNCHSVVHAGSGPSQEALLRGMARARQRLVKSKLSDHEIAHADSKPAGEVRRFFQYTFGVVALGMFLVSMIYIVMKMLVRRDPKKYRRVFKMKKWFRIHEWTSYGFLVASIVHWMLSTRGNAMLHLSLAMVIVLSLSGIGFRYKLLGRAKKKKMRWLHTQRYMAYVLVFLMVTGHLLIAD